ncbi:unnamed protein product [Urochloa humidicola]
MQVNRSPPAGATSSQGAALDEGHDVCIIDDVLIVGISCSADVQHSGDSYRGTDFISTGASTSTSAPIPPKLQQAASPPASSPPSCSTSTRLHQSGTLGSPPAGLQHGATWGNSHGHHLHIIKGGVAWLQKQNMALGSSISTPARGRSMSTWCKSIGGEMLCVTGGPLGQSRLGHRRGPCGQAAVPLTGHQLPLHLGLGLGRAYSLGKLGLQAK